MRVFLRILTYVARHKLSLLAAFGFGLMGVVVELARPWPVKLIVDYVLIGHPLPAGVAAVASRLPGAGTPEGMLTWCIVAGLLIVAAAGLLAMKVLTLTVSIAQRLVYDLSRDLFGKLQRLSLAYHGRHTVGDLLQRMSGDVFAVHFAVSQVALPGTISLLVLVGMFVIMAGLDTTLALVSLAVVPLLAGTLGLFSKSLADTTRRQYERQGKLMAFVEQSLFSIKAIQGFARESYVQLKLDGEARELGEAYGASARMGSLYKEITGFITGATGVLLLYLGATHVMSGRLSIGDLLVFLGYLAALFGPVNALAATVGAAIVVVTRGRRVFEVIDSREEVSDRPDARPLTEARGGVKFENIVFGYHSNGTTTEARPVLHDITFEVQPGQVVAVVGATGAGKSTLVSLLSRFYDPWGGRILVDGVDIRDLTVRSLRENISLVLQEPFLFPMSIADNIGFGRPEASRVEIVAAAEAAHVDDFVRNMPQSYDTVIGEKGGSLSGGERQRIAIARAILKESPILVLDEPTSAVDAHTEFKIFEALSRLMKNKTTFVISHRLSTIRRADMILVLDGGRIVERGSHESLLTLDGVYARLYKHQHIAYS